jgi:two-component system nitrate/nitrite response regulator NarL
MVKTWKIAIVESNSIYREGLQRIFGRSPFKVEIACADLNESWYEIESCCDLAAVLIDAKVGLQNFRENISRIQAALPETRIVLMGDTAGDIDPKSAVEVGLDGFILKSTAGDVIVKSLELVVLGERVFSREVLQAHWSAPDCAIGLPRKQMPIVKILSMREAEVLKSLCQGNPNKVIARHLGISEATVKVHVKAILRKTHAKNRTEAALWAKDFGIESLSVWLCGILLTHRPPLDLLLSLMGTNI